MLALTITNDITQQIQMFNWHQPSWDLFILLFWAGASLLYAFSAGRGRIISLLMSLYIAKLLVLQAPWMANAINQKLPSSLGGLQQLVSFLIVFAVLFVFLGRYAFRTSADGRHFGSIAFSLVFAILQIGLLINIILTYLAEVGREFSPLVRFVFVGTTENFLWLVLPLIYLIILGRAVADPTEL